MTRPIKFRAWDEENNVMVYPKHADQYDHIYSGLNDEGVLEIGYVDQNEDYHEMTPMQFTGLLDKNGKEIYEGDVIEGREVVIELIGIGLRDKAGVWQGQLAHRNTEVEVIGNVWENPELLK